MDKLIPALPLIIGFLLDACIGDPYTIPHPVRLIGKTINATEKFMRQKIASPGLGGVLLVIFVLIVFSTIPALILALCYRIHAIAGILAEAIMIYYLIAPRNLRDESMKVFRELVQGDTERARRAVAKIVGRDTDVLDRSGIIRAAVETVAENTSDGVTAPLFYIALGGAVGGFIYKAVNTMDSMIGYKNETYAEFGTAAARLDDVLNYLPSRLTALLMIAACPLLGLDARNAFRIWKRDRRNHESPNSAQTESACAGALHVQLAGDAWYFGTLHKKPFIGDNDRAIEPKDIRHANRLMYVASVFMFLISVVFRILIVGEFLS